MKHSLSTIKILLSTLFIIGYISASSLAQQTQDDPDPLRFEEEIDQFKEWDAKNSFPKNAILFVGSSSIRLWKTADAFPEFPVINRGFGGSHFSDLLYYYDTLILPYDPSVIVLYEGDNDVADDKTNDQIFEDYLELTNRLMKDFPDAKVVFIPIKPSSSRWEYWPQMKEENERIKAHIDQHDRFYYVDMVSPLLGPDGKPDDSIFRDDQLHLNEKGYAKWNAVIRPILERLLDE